jgi:hypothetical protein
MENTYSNDDGLEASCANTRTVHVDSTSRGLYGRDLNLLNSLVPFQKDPNNPLQKVGAIVIQ